MCKYQIEIAVSIIPYVVRPEKAECYNNSVN